MTVLNKHVVVIRGPTASKTTLITCRKMCGLYKQVHIYIYIAKRRLSSSESSTRTFCVGKRSRGTMGDWEVDVVALLVRVCACVCVEMFVPSTSCIVHFRRRGVIISSFFLHLSHDFV